MAKQILNNIAEIAKAHINIIGNSEFIMNIGKTEVHIRATLMNEFNEWRVEIMSISGKWTELFRIVDGKVYLDR